MRVRARVTGVVQGVGFRPFVYGLAIELGLSGFVLNDADGVLVEVEGSTVEAFVERLRSEAPPLAHVDSVSCVAVPDTGERGFAIRPSPRNGRPDAPISPDVATCDACLAELFDPSNRRYRYPFINCTDCGPRFTIVTGVPYDRPWTTMAAFTMCPACQAEYDDPHDRRFHAQPNACPECGRARSSRALAARRRLPRLPTVPPTRSPRRPRRCWAAPSSRSRASAGSTSPAAPTTRPSSPGFVPASTARTARSR